MQHYLCWIARAIYTSWRATSLLMKIFEPENDEFIFGHMALLRELLQQ